MNKNIPKNIRQIGECNASQKIYIEDYVVTFFKQLSEKKKNLSTVAVLYGKIERDGDGICCFVMGAAECEAADSAAKNVLFSEENRQQALRVGKEYFAQYDLIGWALLESENDHVPKEAIVKTQLGAFADGDKLYYEMHKEDENEQFVFLESGIAHKIAGYHIFYDKNEGMQNYLVNWNAAQEKVFAECIEDRAARQFRSVYYNRKEEKTQRRIVGLLYGTTTLLLMFCCIMGVSMLNNYEKMKGMEIALNHLALALEEQRLPDVAVPAQAVPQSVQPKETQAVPQSAQPKETQAVPQSAQPKEEQQIGESLDASVPDKDAKSVSENTAQYTNTGYILKKGEKESVHAVYTVQKGDTLLKISRRFYDSPDMIGEICALNDIENPNDIMQQQEILLP